LLLPKSGLICRTQVRLLLNGAGQLKLASELTVTSMWSGLNNGGLAFFTFVAAVT
jgi:hypothetical protein